MARLGIDAVVSGRIYMVDMTEFRKVDVVWTKLNEGPYPVSTYMCSCFGLGITGSEA